MQTKSRYNNTAPENFIEQPKLRYIEETRFAEWRTARRIDTNRHGRAHGITETFAKVRSHRRVIPICRGEDLRRTNFTLCDIRSTGASANAETKIRSRGNHPKRRRKQRTDANASSKHRLKPGYEACARNPLCCRRPRGNIRGPRQPQ